MTAPSVALRVCQVGVETTTGAAVPASKRLALLSINPGIGKTGYEAQEQAGSLVPVDVAPGYVWLEGEAEGAISVPDVVYLLASAFGDPGATPVLDGTTSTGAYRRTWLLSGSQPVTPKTLTVEVGIPGSGSNGSILRATGVLATELEFTFNTEEASLGATLYGNPPEAIASMTPSPTRLPRGILQGRSLTVRAAPTLSDLDTVQPLARVREVTISFGEQWTPGVFLGAPTIDLVPTADETEFTIILAADAQGRQRLAEFQNGDTVYFRITALGPRIYDGAIDVYHELSFDLAVKWTEPSDLAGDEDGIWTFEFSGAIVEDADLGGYARITVVTTVNTL